MMDVITYNLICALKQAGYSEAQIQKCMQRFEKQLHSKVVAQLLEDGHTLEEAEILYQAAKHLVEAEDQEVIVNLVKLKK